MSRRQDLSAGDSASDHPCSDEHAPEPQQARSNGVDDERFVKLYLQNVDIMRELSAVKAVLSAMNTERHENKSFAGFTIAMIIMMLIAAALSVGAVVSFVGLK